MFVGNENKFNARKIEVKMNMKMFVRRFEWRGEKGNTYTQNESNNFAVEKLLRYRKFYTRPKFVWFDEWPSNKTECKVNHLGSYQTSHLEQFKAHNSLNDSAIYVTVNIEECEWWIR